MKQQPILLSILIPITPDRMDIVKKLLRTIPNYTHMTKQQIFNDGSQLYFIRYYDLLSPDVEIILAVDNKEMTLGEKRERLYKLANGLYSWQIDSDDDIVDSEYIQEIIEVINTWEPDCITFQERCLINGEKYSSNHSLIYEDWEGDGSRLLGDGFHYHRTPFYKDIIKTEIARSVPFEHIRYGEDHAWSRALKPHLKEEHHIDRDVYFFIHNSKPEEHNERYGIGE